jgi:hypothetical protein
MFVIKLPGKRGMGPSGWTIQAKLQIYMWLGLVKHKKNFVNGLTKGYEVSHEIRNAERPHALPPSVIHYVEKHVCKYVRLELFTVVTMKNAIFWDVMPCGSISSQLASVASYC